MKADDIVEVRMSRAEQAYIYIALGLSHGGLGCADTNLFARLRKELDSNKSLWKAVYKGTLNYEDAVIERDKARVLNVALETIFKPRESEQQKKIRELEETINKAQAQIEESEVAQDIGKDGVDLIKQMIQKAKEQLETKEK